MKNGKKVGKARKSKSAETENLRMIAAHYAEMHSRLYEETYLLFLRTAAVRDEYAKFDGFHVSDLGELNVVMYWHDAEGDRCDVAFPCEWFGMGDKEVLAAFDKEMEAEYPGRMA